MNIGQPVPCISDSACKLSASVCLNDTQLKPCKDFPRVDSTISYEDFFVNFLLPNKPCIFDSFITDSWRGCKEWVGKNGLPDFAFLRENFGSVTVPVANCGQEEYSAHPKQDMLLSEYVDYIIQYKQSRYSPDQPCLYLKDWHFNRDFPGYEAYSTPVYFRSDWLNEFWDLREDIDDDYRFVYIGPKGSWTSFHADVFRSYSWSANICGRKKWIFYFPGEEEKLKDKFGNLIYDVTEPIDMLKYPKSSQIQHRYEVIQESGEVIFVPSGWHHQVFNLEDTISVNHNWLNGCCIENSWRFIKSSLTEVEKEISDCKEMDNWHQQCQLILKASSGINYTEFLQFMKTIADNRIKQLQKYIQSDNGFCDDDELDLLCDLLTNTTVCHKDDNLCCDRLTQKEDDVCFVTQKEDDVCFGTHKEDDVCFGTHKEDDVCFGNHKEDDVCFGTHKEDDVCFVTQKEDDVCFGTHKEDDVCFGTHKEDDVCFGTHKEDDVCFGNHKEDDVCFGTQKEDGMKNGAKYHWQYINIHHAVFDLQQVRKIVCDMLNQPVLNSLAEEHDNSLLLKMADIGQDLQTCEEVINKKPIKDEQTSVEVQITYESIEKRLPCEECDKTDRDKSCDVEDNIDQKLDRHLLSLAKQIIDTIDNILDKFS